MLRLFLDGHEKPNGSQSENILHLQFRQLIQKTMIITLRPSHTTKIFTKIFLKKSL